MIFSLRVETRDGVRAQCGAALTGFQIILAGSRGFFIRPIPESLPKVSPLAMNKIAVYARFISVFGTFY